MSIFNLQQNQNQQSYYYQPQNNCCKQTDNVQILCSNYQCKKSPIMCKNLKCKCHQIHKKCLKTEKNSLIMALEDKLVSYGIIQQTIKREILNSIIQLQQIQTQLLKCCRNKKLQRIGLDKTDIHSLICLKNGQLNKLSGNKIYKTMSNLIKPQRIQILTQNFQQDINQICDLFKQKINLFEQQMKKTINRFSQIHFSSSKVITNSQQQNIIQQFFKSSQKKLKRLSLLFKASDHNFSATKFHKICDQIPQTITIFQTQSGEKFGGYSKVAWIKNNSSKKGFNLSDNSSQSFLFSLTKPQKFYLQSKNHCIFYDKNYGPSFGCQDNYYNISLDLLISDKCNQTQKSYFRPKSTFKSSNKSNEQLNRKFSILQYEVWKVQFDD